MDFSKIKITDPSGAPGQGAAAEKNKKSPDFAQKRSPFSGVKLPLGEGATNTTENGATQAPQDPAEHHTPTTPRPPASTSETPTTGEKTGDDDASTNTAETLPSGSVKGSTKPSTPGAWTPKKPLPREQETPPTGAPLLRTPAPRPSIPWLTQEEDDHTQDAGHADSHDAIDTYDDGDTWTPEDDDDASPITMTIPGVAPVRPKTPPRTSGKTPGATPKKPSRNAEKTPTPPASRGDAQTPRAPQKPRTTPVAKTSEPPAPQFQELLEEFFDDEATPEVTPTPKTQAPVEKAIPTVPAPPERYQTPQQERDAKKAKREREKKKRERQRLRKSSLNLASPSRKGLDSSMAQRGALEYVVTPQGTAVKAKASTADEFQALLQAAEKGAPIAMSEAYARTQGVSPQGQTPLQGKVIYPWSTPTEEDQVVEGDKRDKRLVNQKELDFFRNLSVSKHQGLTDEALAKALRAPALGHEKPSQVRKRQRLAGVATKGAKGYARGRHTAVTEKDMETLSFLGKFRYANAGHVARIFGVREVTARDRLKRLKTKGLVDSLDLWGTTPLWVLTSAGLFLLGYDIPLVTAKNLSYQNIPHQFAVNNTAANLMGGKINVLNLTHFPEKNRRRPYGDLVFGETLVSETEIASSFGKFRGMDNAASYRPRLLGAIERAFALWEQEGGVASGKLSPEQLPGNEYMWNLYPPASVRLNHHAPDLVVVRPRGPDGAPKSIAVEVELEPKRIERYTNTLRAYYHDSTNFEKVIWVCKTMKVAKDLETVAKNVGLWQEGRIDLVPIITEEGIFEGRDLWRI